MRTHAQRYVYTYIYIYSHCIYIVLYVTFRLFALELVTSIFIYGYSRSLSYRIEVYKVYRPDSR